jgi:hypothetical protein
VLRWLRFFQDKADYPYVGRLTGTFFAPASGALTDAYLAFRECAYRTVAERCVFTALVYLRAPLDGIGLTFV